MFSPDWNRMFAVTVRNIAPPDFPSIVCLCGSTRFGDAFREANLRETLAGKIVLSVGCDTKSDAGLSLTSVDKARLDELHKRKIELADSILVLNAKWWRCRTCKTFAPNSDSPRLECDCEPAHGRGEWSPYIGESTRSEIAHATRLGKTVCYLEPLEGDASR